MAETLEGTLELHETMVRVISILVFRVYYYCCPLHLFLFTRTMRDFPSGDNDSDGDTLLFGGVGGQRVDGWGRMDCDANVCETQSWICFCCSRNKGAQKSQSFLAFWTEIVLNNADRIHPYSSNTAPLLPNVI